MSHGPFFKIPVNEDVSEVKRMYFSTNVSRRNFFEISLSALAALPFISCITTSSKVESFAPRLTAMPGVPDRTAAKGLTRPVLNGRRGVTLYVPERYSPDIPAPLFVAMHGSGGDCSDWTSYHARAEERGMVFLAPDSLGSQWDLIKGGYGADFLFLDQTLKYVFNRCNIDTERIAIAGFSDGATYALSLGVSNGHLFSHLIGYSPGFIAGKEPVVGKPGIYISHGTKDTVFPVRVTRDTIVPAFRKAGYDVVYNEFKGGHEVPAAVSEAALDWFLSGDTDTQGKTAGQSSF